MVMLEMLAPSQRPINDTILFGILACQNSDKLEIMIWATIHKSIYLLWLQTEQSLLIDQISNVISKLKRACRFCEMFVAIAYFSSF